MKKLQQPAISAPPPDLAVSRGITAASPPAEKVALFRTLCGLRTDVFPLRWANAKTDRAGYAPACANEWVTGVCGKPRVKCGNCPNQAFVPISDEVIESHLRNVDHLRLGRGFRDFVAGVYPLPGETCRFLAADFDGEGAGRACLHRDVPDAGYSSRARAFPLGRGRARMDLLFGTGVRP